MIYTGYFNKLEYYKEQGLTPVSIAGKSPCFFDGIELKFFAPTIDIFTQYINGEIDEFGYTDRFIPERLDILDKNKVKEQLLSINNPILLCYEKEGFCHRHLVADWIEAHLGIPVAEYKITE